MKFVWTPQAVRGLNRVLAYLEEEWTLSEILNLEENLNDLLIRISTNPQMCPPTGVYKNVHKGLVDKNNYIIYRVLPDQNIIEIINFRGTRQQPLI